MRSRINFLALAMLAFSFFAAIAGAAAQQQQQPKPAEQKTPAKVADEAAEGEKRFNINCGRCHQPPQDLSPSEARAVLRHMRTRAMLSAEDERLILKFIAP